MSRMDHNEQDRQQYSELELNQTQYQKESHFGVSQNHHQPQPQFQNQYLHVLPNISNVSVLHNIQLQNLHMNIGAANMPPYSPYMAADIQNIPLNSHFYSPYVYSYLHPQFPPSPQATPYEMYHNIVTTVGGLVGFHSLHAPTNQIHPNSVINQQQPFRLLPIQNQQLQSQTAFPLTASHPQNRYSLQQHQIPQHSQYLLPFSSPHLSHPTREWGSTFDSLLQMAHQKYNSHDYHTAHSILQDLYNLNRTHLPTLLLLGCTCYSLNLHQLSIFYNNLILSIDPHFAEAFSNLGTTYRAIAHAETNPATSQATTMALHQQQELFRLQSQNPIPDTISVHYPSLIAPTTSGAPPSAMDLAERYYRIAMSIRPKYWDASINLAGLLTSQQRYQEALQVYESLEQNLCALYPPTLPDSDQEFLKLAISIERTSDPATQTRRRDLVFSKANLMYALGDFAPAKREYLRALIIAGVDLCRIFGGITVEYPAIDGDDTIAGMLMTVAKMYQDEGNPVSLMFYYAAVSVKATPNACNNLGILLAQSSVAEAVRWYKVGLTLDNSHVHLYTNLGSAFKDMGDLQGAVNCYQKAISLQPMFWIALANLANLYKDFGRVEEAIGLYRRSLEAKPDFVEAFCNLVNSLLFVCDWEGRENNLSKVKDIVKAQLREGKVPTVLPFHTFTYASLTSWMVREISRRNAERVLTIVENSPWFPQFPKRPARVLLDSIVGKKISRDQLVGLERSLNYPFPYQVPSANGKITIGYVSSDFNNHPLAHLMQSVFGFHDRSRFQVICYSLSPSDNSEFRQKIEKDADVFIDVSVWSIQQIVERIVSDKVHILCNLNGYTKGARNEIFAARPAPIQMAFMGFAGTMGAGGVWDPTNNFEEAKKYAKGYYLNQLMDSWVQDWKGTDDETDCDLDGIRERWIDYMVVDEIACPRKLVCGEPLKSDQLNDQESDLRGSIVSEDDRNRIYTEAMIYMPHSFFVNDHRQGFREEEDRNVEKIVLNAAGLDLDKENKFDAELQATSKDNGEQKFSEMALSEAGEDPEDELTESERYRWRKEEMMRIKMRREVFPWMKEDTVIYANFNQLYKIDPEIFKTWMKILQRVPNSILWLLRFPPSGEPHLKKVARELVPESVASRVVFTDVAPKHIHIHRGRIADVFLDTPECNAHTTAADILWSGTPIITYPKYDFKMCSRVAASIAYATGSWSTAQIKRFQSIRSVQSPKSETNQEIPKLTRACSQTSTSSNVSVQSLPGSRQRIQKTRRTQRKILQQRQIESILGSRRREETDELGVRVPRRRRKYGLDDGDVLNSQTDSFSSDGGDIESEDNDSVQDNDEYWEPRGLQIDNAPRLKDRSLLGHYMVVNNYEEYEEHAVRLGRSMKWSYKPLATWKNSLRNKNNLKSPTDTESKTEQIPSSYPENSTNPTHIFAPSGLLVKLRRRLFLTRDTIPIFDTLRWVRNLERGMDAAFRRWESTWRQQKQRNQQEFELVQSAIAKHPSTVQNNTILDSFLEIMEFRDQEGQLSDWKRRTKTRCLWVSEDQIIESPGDHEVENSGDGVPLQILKNQFDQIPKLLMPPTSPQESQNTLHIPANNQHHETPFYNHNRISPTRVTPAIGFEQQYGQVINNMHSYQPRYGYQQHPQHFHGNSYFSPIEHHHQQQQQQLPQQHYPPIQLNLLT